MKSRRSLECNPQLVAVWNQHEVLYVINPKDPGEYTLTRDAILRVTQITYTPKGRDYMPILWIG